MIEGIDAGAVRIRAGVALGLALLVLVVFIMAVGWEGVFEAAAAASLSVYALAFLATCGTLVARTVVWHKLLGVVDKPRPYWLIGGIFLTSMFAKYVTPYGQVASGMGIAAVVSRYYESAYEESLAGVVSADFLNYLPYYTLGGSGLLWLLFAGVVEPEVSATTIAGIGGVVGVMGLGYIAWLHRGALVAAGIPIGARIRAAVAVVSTEIADRLRWANIARRFEGFYTTLELLSQDRRTIVLAFAWAHIGWLGLAAALYLSALAVGVQLGVATVFVALAFSKLGFIMPTPGGVGGVEIALAAVLAAISPMGFAVATATAILFRFATYWFTVAVGGVTSMALTLKDPLPP
jgi:glycosyltransferase 2 family protein